MVPTTLPVPIAKFLLLQGGRWCVLSVSWWCGTSRGAISIRLSSLLVSIPDRLAIRLRWSCQWCASILRVRGLLSKCFLPHPRGVVPSVQMVLRVVRVPLSRRVRPRCVRYGRYPLRLRGRRRCSKKDPNVLHFPTWRFPVRLQVCFFLCFLFSRLSSTMQSMPNLLFISSSFRPYRILGDECVP